MLVHLLKNPVTLLALKVLASPVAPHETPPVVLLLSPSSPLPDLPFCTVYRVKENAATQDHDSISYDRVVSLLFEADRVVTW